MPTEYILYDPEPVQEELVQEDQGQEDPAVLPGIDDVETDEDRRVFTQEQVQQMAEFFRLIIPVSGNHAEQDFKNSSRMDCYLTELGRQIRANGEDET